MKKRLTFKCWNCGREYTLLRDVEGLPTISVECPYCSKEAVIDLDPNLTRDRSVQVMRGDGDQSIDVASLPTVIPTKPVDQP